MDIQCDHCGNVTSSAQALEGSGTLPLLVCGKCGYHEALLWRKGALYLGRFSGFSAVSTESTGPTTTPRD